MTRITLVPIESAIPFSDRVNATGLHVCIGCQKLLTAFAIGNSNFSQADKFDGGFGYMMRLNITLFVSDVLLVLKVAVSYQ